MICFVINRKSGNGKAAKAWRIVEKQLSNSKVSYCSVFSTDAADAGRQIRALVDGSHDDSPDGTPNKLRCVVVIGGDGTIHGVLPVLIDMGLPLGIIPAGSGNDFARGLNVPFESTAALHQVFESTVQEMDCIYTYDRYAMTVVGIGLDAKVADEVNRSRWKKWFNMMNMGILIYVSSLIYVLMTYRPAQVKLIVDGVVADYDNVWLMAMANLPYFGGGMKISPLSRADDGMLDICIVHGLTRFGLLKAFPKVYKGTHMTHPNVTFVRGSDVQAVASHPLLAHGDGEVLGETPIKIQVALKKLKVLRYVTPE